MTDVKKSDVPVGRRVVVYHRYYGCETGCCGHSVAFAEGMDEYGPETEVLGSFKFGHPDSPRDEDRLAFARHLLRRELGEEHVADLDWEHCIWVESCDFS